MKTVRFETPTGIHLGVVEGDSVIDLQAVDPRTPTDLVEVLAAGSLASLADLAKKAPASARVPLAGIKYATPVGRPNKIICLGLNYTEHVKEGGHATATAHPVIFMRTLTSLLAHNETMLRPKVSETLDYEAELVAVIGKRGKHIPLAQATSYVAGYSCFNDGSVREYQRRTAQWDMGKNFDKTGGFGPFFVSSDELPDGAKGLKIQCRLNGQVMQSDNTTNMTFPVAETIADISRGFTLEPGDLLVMGTPSGVGFARKPPVWMKDGDVVEIDIEKVGVLRNPIKNEA